MAGAKNKRERERREAEDLAYSRLKEVLVTVGAIPESEQRQSTTQLAILNRTIAHVKGLEARLKVPHSAIVAGAQDKASALRELGAPNPDSLRATIKSQQAEIDLLRAAVRHSELVNEELMNGRIKDRAAKKETDRQLDAFAKGPLGQDPCSACGGQGWSGRKA